jgi:hypothetical protein
LSAKKTLEQYVKEIIISESALSIFNIKNRREGKGKKSDLSRKRALLLYFTPLFWMLMLTVMRFLVFKQLVKFL